MYKSKYLKYKSKYLELKNSMRMKGGSNIQKYIDRLDDIFRKHNVSVCHGIKHAQEVMENARQALESKDYKINEENYEAVLLGALLHDADDGKFFPDNHDNENARIVLEDKPKEYVDLVLKMINMVSSSKNGDMIPEDVIGNEWQLIPRYADRLEAIGMIGIERCYTYTQKKSLPLFLPDTPKARTEEELWKIATVERYNAYSGASRSMIDHYYDKLLRLSVFPIRNPFFDKETEMRRKPLIKFVLKFGNDEPITEETIVEFVKGYKYD
jgi:uncharacterized protein